MKPVLVIEGMQGMGDNVYQTPIIKYLSLRYTVYLRTPWPQLYTGIPDLHFLKSDTKLRTQRKNLASYRGEFAEPPAGARSIRLCYVSSQRRGLPLYRGLILSAQMYLRSSFVYDLKLREPALTRGDYAVIRPPTIRAEWKAPSRNPKPEAIQFAIDHLNSRGVETIVVADINHPLETYDGLRPRRARKYFEKGEIRQGELMDLIHRAKIAVGGVGFIAPLCIGLGTPAVIIHGGAGGFNSPQMIDAPGAGKLTHVLPDNHCLCRNHRHTCNKNLNLETLKTKIDSLL